MSSNNLNQLFNKLNRLADTRNYKAVFDESAKAVETEAKANCPVETGRLKDSIEGTATAEGFKVSANTDYASIVEYGTLRRAPEPYLMPAMENNKTNTLNNIKKEIRRLY